MLYLFVCFQFIKMDLPNPNEKFDPDSMTPEETRAKVSVFT